MRHGGQVLVDQLVRLDVRRVFSAPGESFIAALDGLHDADIDNIVCRQEGGAAMMAEAFGSWPANRACCLSPVAPVQPMRPQAFTSPNKIAHQWWFLSVKSAAQIATAKPSKRWIIHKCLVVWPNGSRR